MSKVYITYKGFACQLITYEGFACINCFYETSTEV